MHEAYKKYILNFLENLNSRNSFGDDDMGKRMILKWIIVKRAVRVWIALH
jgi:hypothetical protein